MKKLTLLFAFFLVAGLTSVQAQSEKSCAKTCTKAEQASCHKAKASMAKADVSEAAVVAASLNENIEKKVCAKSGNVSFVEKSVCDKSGKVSYAEVQYDAATGKFVSLETSLEDGMSNKAKAACSGQATAGKAGCCSKAKSAKVSATEKADTKKKGA